MSAGNQSPFDRNFNPPVGHPEIIAEGLKRIVAPNASPMTFTGTNTYLLGSKSIAVIDPGPDDQLHVNAILAGLPKGSEISEILITHSHIDHSAASTRLSKLTGAPVRAFGDSRAGRNPAFSDLAGINWLKGGEGVDAGFSPDTSIECGSCVKCDEWTLEAIWTPGHFGNHLCFAWLEGGAIFSGDVLMGWSTTLISPPDGHIGDFLNSLKVLEAREEPRFFPGHGAPVDNPRRNISYQAQHRRIRESQILARIADESSTASEIAEEIYEDIDPRLIPAAARNVFAHLLDLWERGLVVSNGELTPCEKYCLKRS